MREGRVATLETSNSPELTAIKSQIDTLAKQVNALVQHANTQAVTHAQPMSVMSQPSVNVTSLPVNSQVAGKPMKPMQWQQNSKPNGSARPKSCFNCGDPSHFKPQCPLLQANTLKSKQLPDTGKCSKSSTTTGMFYMWRSFTL